MALKEEVLALLEETRGNHVSGEDMADRLCISRNAVWKAIQQLREDGYEILSATNRGYCLPEWDQRLSEQGIRRFLTAEAQHCRLEIHRSLDSTNLQLKRRAEEGVDEGLAVLAELPTAGRGRLGRSFYSPVGAGLYISLLLRPTLAMEQVTLITTAAAAATAAAIERATGKQAGIKWVNDLYYQGKKLCGILTEASMDAEGGGLAYAVLGIGINVVPPPGGFPEELRDRAAALYETAADCPPMVRSRLAAEVLNVFWTLYRRLPDRAFLEDYRRRSILTGRDISFLLRGEPCRGRVLSVDDDARLVVRLSDGREERLLSGEVTIGRLDG